MSDSFKNHSKSRMEVIETYEMRGIEQKLSTGFDQLMNL